MKNLWIIVLIIVGILALVFFVEFDSRGNSEGNNGNGGTETTNSDPLNTTYTIDEQEIPLQNGLYEEQIPNSSTKITTTVWGTPKAGDLTGDNIDDAAVVLVQDPGGSGIFYYVAAALNEGGDYFGTNAIYLGDRLAMQNYLIQDQTIIVNYADRPEGSTFEDSPSVAISRYFQVKGDVLVEIDNPNLPTN